LHDFEGCRERVNEASTISACCTDFNASQVTHDLQPKLMNNMCDVRPYRIAKSLSLDLGLAELTQHERIRMPAASNSNGNKGGDAVSGATHDNLDLQRVHTLVSGGYSDEEAERGTATTAIGMSTGEMIAFLHKGNMFMKHGRHGAPKRRWVWMSQVPFNTKWVLT
jgi:hypothetical protein